MKIAKPNHHIDEIFRIELRTPKQFHDGISQYALAEHVALGDSSAKSTVEILGQLGKIDLFKNETHVAYLSANTDPSEVSGPHNYIKYLIVSDRRDSAKTAPVRMKIGVRFLSCRVSFASRLRFGRPVLPNQ